MKAIIFGSNGQDGYFLNKVLESNNIEVINISRNTYPICGDISSFSFVYEIIKENLPEYIFHFAAISSTKHEFLFDNNAAISIGTINLLESVKLVSPKTKIFLSGSALQFKNNGRPINEETVFEPSSHYAVARIHSVYLGRYYREVFGLKIYIGYFFNHDSEFRSDEHINKKIIDQLKLIKEGKKEKLVIGDVEVEKEFNFAGDVVQAVWLLVNQNKINEAIIGSGLAYSIKDWIKIVCDLINLNYDSLKIEVDFKFKSEYKILVSNPERIKELGWYPEVDIYKLAERMVKTYNFKSY
jgi:GDPmannose 4,6-dehydratase